MKAQRYLCVPMLAPVVLLTVLLPAPVGQAQSYPQQAQAQPYPQQDPPLGYAQQQYPPDSQQDPQQYADPGPQDYGQLQPPQQPLNVEQLEQLVAPIALYPDTLVAQVLAAATYPAQIVDADRWRQAQGYAPPDQVVYGANAQTWDPSVKALTAFPQLLAQLDRNLRWTAVLGNAYYNQPQDVLDVVQVMRQRAQAAGTLQSSPQESLSYDQGYIQLAPPDPQVVYVPSYDPWNAYGQPISPYPGFSFLGALGSVGSFLGRSLLHYGPGIGMTAFNHSPFGLLEWGLNWLSHSVLFHQSPFYSHSTTVADWGFPHGGPRAYSQRGEYRASDNFNHSYRQQGAYNRPSPDSRTGDQHRGDQFREDQRLGDQRFARNNSYTHLPGQRFVPSSEANLAANQSRRPEDRQASGNYRSYQQPQASYARPPQQEAYNRFQPAPGRQQQLSRTDPRQAPGFGAGFNSRQTSGYAIRPNPVLNSRMQNNRPLQAYRAPQQYFQRNEEFANRSYSNGFANDRGYDQRGNDRGRGFSGKAPKFSNKELKAPKAPKAEKGFKAPHSSGGGIFGHGAGHGGGGHHR